MDVAIVRWPEEESRREELARAAAPCLLLVDEGAPPPIVDHLTEDWVRLPARDDDIRARVQTLVVRTTGPVSGPPTVVDDVMVVGSTHLPLPPVEARLASALIERPGAVVSRAALARAGWPEGMPSRNALDVRMLRLRRRIEPLGLVVRTVRHRGYLLDGGAAAAP